jgi:drug/metabolite transporter (DMT)-like permease
MHATWNYLVKRAGVGTGSVTFAWLFTVISVVLFLPLAVWVSARSDVQWSTEGVLFLAGSGVLHAVYFVLLLRGYRVGDLSLIYPLSRGTGPVLASIAAVVLLGERLSVPAVAGIVLVATGAFVVTGGTKIFRDASSTTAVGYALLIGSCIGAYTVWDKHLVGALAVPPIAVEWWLSVSIGVLLTPLALRERYAVVAAWRAHRGTAILGALLSSGSYILFLTALSMSAVSRVAPVREVSIVIGAAMGSRLLAEPDWQRRLAGAAAISVGVGLLAFV